MFRSFLIRCLSLAAFGSASGQMLYPEFLTPSFDGQANTEYSQWDIFTSAYNGANSPDVVAPNSPETNPANPTITQNGTNTAFIVGVGTTGNIYSFSAPTAFVTQDATPFTLGTVSFQFQTEGALMDYDSIRLVYVSGGVEVSLAPADILKEFHGGSSPRGGVETRTAVQWNLSGLGITSYQIRFAAADASMSFQRAFLDTAAAAATVVPVKGIWTGSGSAWSGGGGWQAGSAPAAGANVVISGGSALTLDSSRKIGELHFTTTGNFTLGASGGSALTIDTGITTPGGSGTYTVNAPIVMGGLQYEDIGEGSTVILNGNITPGSYGGSDGAVAGGFIKEGLGTLVINGNITGATGSVFLADGTLKLAGANTYTGANAIQGGTLILAANAPLNSAGALGLNANAINIGAAEISATDPPPATARVLIEGAHQVAKHFAVIEGNSLVVFGGYDTGVGAQFSGNITFADSNDVELLAQGAADLVRFSGGLSGGSLARTLTKTGAGTVVFSGGAKTYANATVVQAGTLEIASGVSTTGNGSWQAASGATLRVNGTLGGSGALTLDGGTISGSGSVAKGLTLDAGDRVAPGDGVGALTFTAAQTWAGGGGYEWQIANAAGAAGVGWDVLRVNGAALNLTATAGNQFTLYLNAITLDGFDPGQAYAWEIASAANVAGFNEAAFAIEANGWSGDFSVSLSGNSLYLNYAPVPEPAIGALLLLGGVAICAARRKNKRR